MAVGVLCTDVDETVARAAAGESIILVRPETSPADVHGMAEARGLVTTLGGMVSHAAVVARSWGLPAVVGATALRIDADGGVIGATGRLEPGTVITVDGDRGAVYLGAHGGDAVESADLRVLRTWRDELVDSTATGGSSAATAASPVDATALRRLLSIRGMAMTAGLVETLGDADAVETTLIALADAGDAEDIGGGRWRLCEQGATAATAAFAAEAETAAHGLETHMPAFNELNLRFKELITAWQTRMVDGEQQINDHTDADYDAEVLRSLASDVHGPISELLGAAATSLGRLADYVPRFDRALAAIERGDQAMVAHPLKDSYHTVWFELHEELIRLTGRDRATEDAH